MDAGSKLIIILLLLLSSASQDARADVRSKLQWFDAHGEIIDLDWPRKVQWIWNTAGKPAAEVDITVPEQIQLVSEDEKEAKILTSQASESGKAKRMLIVEMDSPRKTVKLKKLDADPASSEVGLTLMLANDAPNFIPSETCEKAGINIEPRQQDANFLFIAASCKVLHNGVRVQLQTSHDALLAKDEDQSSETHFGDHPLELFFPKKDFEKFDESDVMATVRAQSQNTPPMTTQFEVVYTKTNHEKVAQLKPQKIVIAPTSAPLITRPWLFHIEGDFTYLDYQNAYGSHSPHSSEFNFGARLGAEHTVFSQTILFKEELTLPLATLMSDPRIPAGGLYQSSTRLSFTLFDHGKIAMHLEPGFEIDQAYSKYRADLNGFYGGPLIAFDLVGTIGAFGNRQLEAYASMAPLMGGKNTSFLNSYDVIGQLAMEMIKGEAGHHWDFLVRYQSTNFHAPTLSEAKASQFSVGLRTGI